MTMEMVLLVTSLSDLTCSSSLAEEVPTPGNKPTICNNNNNNNNNLLIKHHMVVTSEALGAWHKGLMHKRHKSSVKAMRLQIYCFWFYSRLCEFPVIYLTSLHSVSIMNTMDTIKTIMKYNGTIMHCNEPQKCTI